ncbi:hypothetical protein CAOG_02180 [Capsaspora owczarzaki ATCC 30864]|nr:hypothetical protein CAOG_02180 [Capsaspora owczarzaki ATCC 30864]|eukprot:XP_004348930.1 hypothetical protein CAOG_02180 [Capsaspora owczarzaki ATCC 30864]
MTTGPGRTELEAAVDVLNTLLTTLLPQSPTTMTTTTGTPAMPASMGDVAAAAEALPPRPRVSPPAEDACQSAVQTALAGLDGVRCALAAAVAVAAVGAAVGGEPAAAPSSENVLDDRSTISQLSLQQTRAAALAIQLVLCWGVLPYVDPGVAGTGSLRVSPRAAFDIPTLAALVDNPADTAALSKRISRLDETVSGIVALLGEPALRRMIINRYMVDVLCALCQLAHWESTLPSSTMTLASTSQRPHVPSAGASSRLIPPHRARLHQMLEASPPSTVIEALTVILSGGHATPAWLTEMCSRYLSLSVMRPDGVRSLLLYLLEEKTPTSSKAPAQSVSKELLDDDDDGDDDADEDDDDDANVGDSAIGGDFAACDRAARIVTAVPAQAKSPEAYLSHVGPQLVALLHISNTQHAVGGALLRTVGLTVSRMLTAYPNLVKQRVLDPVWRPLYVYYENDRGDGPEPTTDVLGDVQDSEQDLHSELLELAPESKPRALSGPSSTHTPLIQVIGSSASLLADPNESEDDETDAEEAAADQPVGIIAPPPPPPTRPPQQPKLQPHQPTLQPSQDVLVGMSDIIRCVEDTHKLFVVIDPHPALMVSVAAMVEPLFQLYRVAQTVGAKVASACQEILVTYLKHAEPAAAVADLRRLVLGSSQASSFSALIPAVLSAPSNLTSGDDEDADDDRIAQEQRDQEVNFADEISTFVGQGGRHCEFALTPNGQQIVLCRIPSQQRASASSQSAVDNLPTLLALLSTFKHHQLTGDFFMSLLDDYAQLEAARKSFEKLVRSTELDSKDKPLVTEVGPASSSSPSVTAIATSQQVPSSRSGQPVAVELLDPEEDEEDSEGSRPDQAAAAKALANNARRAESDLARMEQQLDLASKHAQRLLQVILTVAEGLGAELLKSTSHLVAFARIMLQNDDVETVVMCLSLLGAVLAGAVELSVRDASLLASLGPVLDETGRRFADDETIVELIADLRVNLHTRHGSEAQEGASSSEAAADAAAKRTAESEAASAASFELVLEQLRDPLLPVRAHALIELRNKILARDSTTVSRIKMVLAVFQSQLVHPDTYMYLSAIHGLVAVGDVFPSRAIPILLKEYAATGDDFGKETTAPPTAPSSANATSTNVKKHTQTLQPPLPAELRRTRVGEALLFVCERLGEVLPKYGLRMIDVFMRGIRDSSAMMRASSLSNLATACQIMRFALHPIINEILACIESVLQTESEAEVRRGAAHVLTRLLRGLGIDVLELIPDRLKSIYRLLRATQRSDPDPATRQHATYALREISSVMRRLLAPLMHGPDGTANLRVRDDGLPKTVHDLLDEEDDKEAASEFTARTGLASMLLLRPV